MPTINVDSDGTPFWEQPVATKWDYNVDWRTRLNANNDSVASSDFSAVTSGLLMTSTVHTASGLHTGWVAPSTGNAGKTYYFVSKIFTDAGRIERTRIKVNVLDAWIT